MIQTHHVLSLFILHFAVVVSASQYYNMFKFLPRDRDIEEANGEEPIITVEDDRVIFANSPNTHYDFKLYFGPKETSSVTVENGPEGFGCFVGCPDQPYRSHFITKDRALEETISEADYIHCYALEFPNRDVLVEVMNLEGLRSSVVVNTEQGFGSLPIPINYSYIDSIALVEEADDNLSCRVDLSNGEQLFMTRENPELTNITGAKFIGCRLT